MLDQQPIQPKSTTNSFGLSDIILDSIPAFIVYKDTSNNILKVNQSFAQAIGIPKSGLEGKNCSELWPAQAKSYYCDDRDVIKSKQPKKNIIQLFESKTKGKIWLSVDKIPYYNKNQEIIGILCFSIDITQERKNQQQLEEKIKQIKDKIKNIMPVLQKVSLGIFTARVEIPDQEDEFTELLVAIDLMIDDLEEFDKNRIKQEKDLKLIIDQKTQQIRKEKEMAEKYLNIAETMIIALDSSANVILLNKKGYEVLGYEEGELLGRNWFDCCLPPESLKSVKSVFSNLMQGKADIVKHYDNPVITKTGVAKLISWHNTLIKDDSGNISGVLSSGIEITEKKKIELALKKSEKQLKEITQNLTEAIFSKDSQGKYTFVNPAAAKLMNRPAKEIIGKTAAEIFEPKYADRIKQVDQETVKSQKVERIEELDVKGKKHLLRTTQNIIKSERGENLGIVGVVSDVTKDQQSRVELEKLAAVTKYTQESISIYALDGSMTFLNDAGSEVFGIDKDKVSSHHLLEIIPESYVDVVKNKLQPALKEKGLWEGNLKYKNIKTGKLTPVHVMAFTIKDPKTQKALYSAHVAYNRSRILATEEKIKQNQMRLQDLAMSLADLIWEIDAEGRYTYMAGRVKEILGYSEQELIGKTPFDIMSPDEIAKNKKFFKELSAKKLPIKNLESWTMTKNGHKIAFLINGIPIIKDGELIGYRGVDKDITKQKIAEIKLERSKERYESIVQSSQDAIVISEPPDWKFTSGNPAAIKMFNVQNEKNLVMRSPWEYSPKYQPDGQLSKDKALQMIDKALKEGSNTFEWVHMRLEGEEFPTVITLTKIFIAGHWAMQATIRDVSVAKKAEEKIQAKVKELERMNSLMIGRELKMIELKKEINKLKHESK